MNFSIPVDAWHSSLLVEQPFSLEVLELSLEDVSDYMPQSLREE